jgi:hypothetical protein
MDLSSIVDWIESLRAVLAFFGVMLALVVAGIVWRVRGLFSWERSQRYELAALRREQQAAEGITAKVYTEILSSCEAIWRSPSLDLDHVKSLPHYWRRIAGCYYPDQPQPELCLSVGRLLAAAQQVADRLNAMLQRPGFNRIGRLRVGQVRRSFDRYQRLTARPTVAWFLARRRTIRTVRHAMRVALPDPLVWIAYLSQRLTVMMAVRCLLVDLYLSTGKIAMKAFDTQRSSTATGQGERASRTALDAYGKILETEHNSPLPDALEQIRSDLTGLPGRLWQPPGVDEWYQAVEQAAHIIAAGHFPESRSPLDEATCHVLLERSCYWLEAMAAARRLPVVRPLYGISIKRLQQIKVLSESDLLQWTGKVAGSIWSVWRWARWPVQLLRWIRRRSPAGVALELGSTLALKAMHNYLARYGFDHACQELDIVYRLSNYNSQESFLFKEPFLHPIDKLIH